GATPLITEAQRRGQDYLLERRLLRGLSTGALIDPTSTRHPPRGFGRRGRRAESVDHAARSPRAGLVRPPGLSHPKAISIVHMAGKRSAAYGHLESQRRCAHPASASRFQSELPRWLLAVG